VDKLRFNLNIFVKDFTNMKEIMKMLYHNLDKEKNQITRGYYEK